MTIKLSPDTIPSSPINKQLSWGELWPTYLVVLESDLAPDGISESWKYSEFELKFVETRMLLKACNSTQFTRSNGLRI